MAKTETSTKKSGNFFNRLIGFADTFQRHHRFAGFPYAVVKKYGEDEAGKQAALLTYYGFLSLFPLLVVATSVIDLISQHNAHLRDSLLHNIDKYFPIIGDQLRLSVHNNSKSGIALLIGILVTMYGARGIADATRGALDHAWATPRVNRSGFPKSTLKSMALLFGAGFGLLIAAALAGVATSAFGHSLFFRIIPIIVNVGLLYLIFMYVFLIGTSGRFPRSYMRVGALTAAGGLLVLQALGVGLIQHQLHSLQGLYGQFALVLAILFWIYLQAQVFTYAIEINVVHAYRLWPRSIVEPLTAADKKSFSLYPKKEALRPQPEEEINVTFETKS